MTSELKLPKRSQPHSADLPATYTGANQSMGDMDRCQRDRFELLSAYLDGEVTAAERRQVEQWLKDEPEVQCLYARLLKLRQGIQTLPVPQSQRADQTVQQVFTRIKRQRTRRAIWGGAIAALFVGSLSGVFASRPALQIAQRQPTPEVNSTLMVALNGPVVEIPKAAVVAPEPHVINQVEHRHE